MANLVKQTAAELLWFEDFQCGSFDLEIWPFRGVCPLDTYALTQPPAASNPSHVKLCQVGYTHPYSQHRLTWTLPYS